MQSMSSQSTALEPKPLSLGTAMLLACGEWKRKQMKSAVALTLKRQTCQEMFEPRAEASFGISAVTAGCGKQSRQCNNRAREAYHGYLGSSRSHIVGTLPEAF